MTRRESREQAFALLFEKTFHDAPVVELANDAMEARDIPASDFAMMLAVGVEQHIEELDAKISAYSQKWDTTRMSRVALSVMRLALYEMLYEESIPVSVSINEAVELAKKYGGAEDAPFINGILGTASRQEQTVGEL